VAEEKQDEGRLPDELASNIVKFSELLDPHLKGASEARKTAKPERWSRRRAGLFIITVSLILWGAIFAIIHYVHRFLAMRGRA
jgi:hypothetical protein